MQSWAPVTMQADHDIRLFPRVGDTFPLPFGVTDLPLALDKSFKVLSSPYPYFEESRSSLSASSLSSPTRDSTLSDSDVYEGVSDLGSPEESGKRMSFYSIDSLATVKRRRLGDSFDREQTLTSDGERTQWDIIKDDDLPIDLPSDLPLPLIPAIITPDSPTEYDRRYAPQSPFPSLKQTTGFPVLMCGPSEMVERTPSSSSSVEEAAASSINTLKEIRETRCALMGLEGGIRDLLRKGLLDLAQNADESVKLGPNDEIIRDITLRALYTLPPMKEPIENCI